MDNFVAQFEYKGWIINKYINAPLGCLINGNIILDREFYTVFCPCRTGWYVYSMKGHMLYLFNCQEHPDIPNILDTTLKLIL